MIIQQRPRSSKKWRPKKRDHQHQLIDEFRRRFGERIPLIRREDVKGFITRKPVWLIQTLGDRDGAPLRGIDGGGNAAFLRTSGRGNLAIHQRESSWGISPKQNASMSKLPTSWKNNISPGKPGRMRTWRTGVYLSCKLCSRALAV